MSNLHQRIGKVFIDRSLVITRDVSIVLQEMQFVPWQVQSLAWMGSDGKFEYIGTSPLFDEMAEAEILPVYEITFDSEFGNVSAERVEQS